MNRSGETLRDVWRVVRMGGLALAAAFALSAVAPELAFAQEAPAAVETAAPEAVVEEVAVEEAAAPALTVDKGDTGWMLISTVLVLIMIIPGLALFYGGLVRA